MEAGVTTAWRHVNGVRLRVKEAGPEDGPLVIMLHGFPDAWWTWRHQIGPLAERGYRVVVPDQRGYTLSDKPPGVAAYRLDELVADVIGLADAYERPTIRLVGHDWGGIIAYATALRHPERIERLAVMGAPHPDILIRQALRHPTQIARSLYAAFFQLPRLPEALLSARNFALLRRAMTAIGRPGTFSPTDLDRYAEGWSQPGALTAMLNYYRALRPTPPWKTPARVTPPTLVVIAGRDPALGPYLFRASLELCKQGEGLVMDEATHWVHLEDAEIITAELVRFFGESTAGVAS